MPTCKPFLDPYQFAYKAKRGVEDAILSFTNNVYKQLDTPKTYIRTMFIDFSSAFNTIQPHILVPKLLNMNVNKPTVLWILDFLTERPQFVSLRSDHTSYTSKTVVTNAGAPQGTVLAPTLFSIYTNECRSFFKNISIFKYADDTTIQAIIRTIKDLMNYKEQIRKFVKWCDDHYLLLNIKKTKELILDFRLNDNDHEPIEIKGEPVEIVKEYKYLGVIFDKYLEWHAHAAKVLKSMNQRMYFMRKLHSYQLDTAILSLFFNSCVKSIMCFCLTAWGGNNRENEKRRMNRCLKSAGKML